MRVGAGLAMMNLALGADAEVYRTGLALADRVEALGFDSIWTVEHHFTGHSPVPNALQLLAYLAGRTERLLLGTAVLVLPWHNPLRVAEEISALDVISNGRAHIGVGRGRSEVEFNGFGIPMEERAARFDEALDIVQMALTSERFSYDGRFTRCTDLAIRPRSTFHPERRLYQASHSLDAAKSAGSRGLGLLISPERDDDSGEVLLEAYRHAAVASGFVPAAPVVHFYVAVDYRPDRARALAERYMTPMVEALGRHYRVSVNEIVAGADSIASGCDAARAFIRKHVVGTPDECLARIEAMRARFGTDHFIGEFAYGGMPHAEADRNMQCFATEVAPGLRALPAPLGAVS
jgi:alkanesulfonate monooxygenase SsuD/methylene tetrahydromethanopterin reductase-like flavin-dependent oxidoreductase (luciferase family)